MKRIFTALLVGLYTCAGFAAANRQLDAVTITTGNPSNVLTLPTGTSDTVAILAGTQTFTNKTMSGASNTFTNIPASAVSSGQVAVANGGTGLSSGTSGGILGFTASGTIASSVALTANALVLGGGAGATPTPMASLGTTTTVLHGNAAGAPTFGAVSLTADVSGTLPVGNGGTGVANPTAGSVLVGNGSSAVSLVAPSTSGNVLTSNGTTWTSAAAPGTPNIVGTTGSPTAITAVGGVSFSGTNYANINFIQGSGGAVTVTANPQITAGTNVGQQLTLIGRSATNTVTLADGTGLSLNGTWVGGLQSVLNLTWDGTVWVERSRR